MAPTGTRSCSSTGPATTTGASPRASATATRPTRRPRCGKWPRRPDWPACWAPSWARPRYQDNRGRPKIVRYWLMTVATDRDGPGIRPRRRGRRVPLVRARRRGQTSHVLVRSRLVAAPEEPGMTVYLVRHARAGRRSAWKGDDRLRPLSKVGRRQAAALVDLLVEVSGDREIEEILSSPYVRCRQSVDPLAKRLGLKVARRRRARRGRRPRGSAAPGREGVRPRFSALHPRRHRGAVAHPRQSSRREDGQAPHGEGIRVGAGNPVRHDHQGHLSASAPLRAPEVAVLPSPRPSPSRPRPAPGPGGKMAGARIGTALKSWSHPRVNAIRHAGNDGMIDG